MGPTLCSGSCWWVRSCALLPKQKFGSNGAEFRGQCCCGTQEPACPVGPLLAWQRQEPNQAAQHLDWSHGPLQKQTAVCSSKGKRPSRILFPLLDPQAHFCGVKSYFPVLRMLHFPLLLFERPTKTNGENN